MTEKRMLIVDAEVARKVEENRGDLTRSDFVSFLIDSCLETNSETEKPNYITKEEFLQFQEGTKELLRNFLDFFVSYGMELGKQPADDAFQELNQTLQAISSYGKKK
ncbi:MAG: hypothetical protein Q8O55_10445 [Dehalococcoidales bacterium]|nr:hypothetical protein [Dehalococcoidales bacterium]